MEEGEWRMEDGLWMMEGGEWRMEYGIHLKVSHLVIKAHSIALTWL